MKLRKLVWALSLLVCLGAAEHARAEPRSRAARIEAKKKAKRARRKQQRAAKRRKRQRERRGAGAPSQEPSAAHARDKKPTAARTPSRAAEAAAEAAKSASGEGQVIKEGDTSVKVMSFSGLDIEGRVRSPQLLYFVNRVHAEFERPTLPHRSFMPELSRSTRKSPIR